MAQLDPQFHFTGPLGNLSAYRMQGVDKIILRKKGGASRDKIRTAPSFEHTRRLNSEFTGRARGVRAIMRALHPLKPLADYNFYGALNAAMKPVQERDLQSEFGKRNIILSQHVPLLQGFSLNRYTTLDTLVRTPLKYAVASDTLKATVEIPELIPGITFFPPQKHSAFSVMAVLGVVPDLYYKDDGYEPTHPEYARIVPATATTPWLHVSERLATTTLEVKLESAPADDACVLLLSVGICFGTPFHDGSIHLTKRAGSTRILAVVGGV